MRFKDSLDIVLRECRFVPDEAALKVILPDVAPFMPPLTAIRFTDGKSPRFTWGFPVVHGRRLLGHLYALFSDIAGKILEDPSYKEKLHALTPEQLKADTYFRSVSDLLTRTVAEGGFLKLDSVLWLYLLDALSRRLVLDDGLNVILKAALPDDFERLTQQDHPLLRLRYRDTEAFSHVRNQLLRSFFARHEYAVSCMKEIFGEIPRNPLSRAMVDHRYVFTEKQDALYHSLDLKDAFDIKTYRQGREDFHALNQMLQRVIAGILRRRAAGQLLAPDTYFLQLADLELAVEKSRLLPGGLKQGDTELSEVDRIALWLSLQEKPSRYLLYHLGEFAKAYLKPIERQLDLSRDVIKALRSPVDRVVVEGGYREIVQDVMRWDFFNVLRSKICWVDVHENSMLAAGRPLAETTVPLNLDAYHEVYRRSRHGTAVFFDLIGFTDKTKTLAKRPDEKGRGRAEERSKFSFMSLAIQKLFSVRQHLPRLGGEPQGFEGDAILDIFPKALNALRYVALFADNYEANRTLRYRPFERPALSPYQDGWRVGLASGDFTVISIVGRTNEMSPDAVHERAVGHTVNRASRLNSGKKGAQGFLVDDPEMEGGRKNHDPLGVLKVRVDRKRKLTNSGICAFEDTFEEVVRQVKEERLPWYEPLTGRGSVVRGLRPSFNHYRVSLIFDEPKLDKIFLALRLPLEPELKGLEDEQRKVYEILMLTPEAFTDFCEREARLEPVSEAKGAAEEATFEFGEAGGDEGGGWLGAADGDDPYAAQNPYSAAPGPAHDPGPGFGVPSAVRLARLKQVEAKGIPAAALIGREERLLKNREVLAWKAAAASPPPSHVAEAAPEVPPAAPPVPEEPTAGQPSPEASTQRQPSMPSAASPTPPPSPEPISQEPAPAPPPSTSSASTPVDVPASRDTSTGHGAIGAGGAAPRARASVAQVVGGERRVAEALSFISDALPGSDEGLSLSLSLDEDGGLEGELGGDDSAFVDPFAVSGALSFEEGQASPAVAAQPAAPSPAETRHPPAQPPEPSVAPRPPEPPRPAPAYELDRYDVEGFAYALEEGNGPDSPPTAILVGCPRQDVLQDCRRYEAAEFGAGWSLDAVLKRFVGELAGDLSEGLSQPAHKLPRGTQVYLLDAAYLMQMAKAP